MNYYEEFGLDQSASIDEIRQAHKKLVRIVHPDRLQNDELRELAEHQMKRVNGIFEVLSDPKRRKEYDSGLTEGTMPLRRFESDTRQDAAWQAWVRAALKGSNAVWVGAALLCFLVLYLAMDQHSASGPPTLGTKASAAGLTGGDRIYGPPAIDEDQAAESAPSNEVSGDAYQAALSQLAQLRKQVRRLETQRDTVLEELAEARVRVKENSVESHQSPVMPITPSADRVIARNEPSLAVPDPEPVQQVHSAGLGGVWFYVPGATGNQKLAKYPPQYIELHISEASGQIKGRYRATYRVNDSAISPNVSFQFAGERNTDERYSWSGQGGARGQIRFELLSPDSLQVGWYANRLGSLMGLGSGSAVLIRRQNP